MFSRLRLFNAQLKPVSRLSTLPKNDIVAMKYDLYMPNRSTMGKLAYHCEEPIIFMHGIFGNRRLYKDDCQLLANVLQTAIYAVDIRNHGDTKNSLPFNYQTLVNDLKAFVKVHKLKKPSLIGYSLGAKIGMLATLQSPNKFSSLVCIDNVPIDQPEIVPFLTAFGKALSTIVTDSNVLKSDKNWIYESNNWMKNYLPAKDIIDYLSYNVTNRPSKEKSYFNESEKNSLFLKVPVPQLEKIIQTEVPSWPSHLVEGTKVNNPALFIKASSSGFIEEKGVQAIQKYFNNFTIHEIKGTHLVMFERKQEYLKCIRNWFLSTNINHAGLRRMLLPQIQNNKLVLMKQANKFNQCI